MSKKCRQLYAVRSIRAKALTLAHSLNASRRDARATVRKYQPQARGRILYAVWTLDNCR